MPSDEGVGDRMLKKRRESNRLCAQRRRARQKRQIEDLQEEAYGLSQDNERWRDENETLRRMIEEQMLEGEELRRQEMREMQQSRISAAAAAAAARPSSLSSVATVVAPTGRPPRFHYLPPMPITTQHIPYPFNSQLTLDEYVSVVRPSLLPASSWLLSPTVLPPTVSAMPYSAPPRRRELPSLISAAFGGGGLGLASSGGHLSSSQLVQRAASLPGRHSDRADFPLQSSSTFLPAFASDISPAVATARMGKASPQGNVEKERRRRRRKRRSYESSSDEDDEDSGAVR